MDSLHAEMMKALNSYGFAPIVNAIKNGYLSLAELLIREAEIEYSGERADYTDEEDRAICMAFDECYRQLEKRER